ncbi:MAG: oxidoreductase [Piscirickettsiaceae bacterium]|nr:MAG: oxidoreductase [Piscirickettsiaceae bacterium]
MKQHLKSLLYMSIAGVLFWLFLPVKYTVNMPIQFANSYTEKEVLEKLTVEEGYAISVFADNLSNARAIITTETNDLIVSRPNIGTLTLVYKDNNQDGRSDGQQLLLKGLDKPHGIALHDGWLYVAETSAVLRIQYDSQQRKFIGIPHYLMRESFPGGGNHWSRTVKIGPDNKLYVSVGSSCNVCIESSPKRASILQYELDGSNEKLFASGLRNTVGFDWQPSTNLMYGVNNGRDLMGDDIPPEELNQINMGQHYGWPFEHANTIADPDYAKDKPIGLNITKPSHLMTAHSAPLSLLFIRNNTALKGTALVALHGSWNRSKKSGYKIIALSFNADSSISQRDFVNGFEIDETVTGRPVDLAEDKHGNIYLSDDYSGKIYKITSAKSNQNTKL